MRESKIAVAVLLATMLGLCGTNAASREPNVSIVVAAAPTVATCDIGPPAAIPPEAQAAGLTHCVANFDFSQSAYSWPPWAFGGGAATWVDCFGESANNPNILWHGGSAGIREFSPCDIHQKTDSLTGQTVMNFQWLPGFTWGSQYFGSPQANQVSIQTNNMYTGSTYNPTLTVPNYYVETVNRIEASCPASACSQNSGGPDDVYMWGYINSPDGGGLEVDIQEFQTNALNGTSGTGVAAGNMSEIRTGQAYWSNWGPNKANLPAGYSNLSYHNYGALLTSDGQTDQRVCMFIDDTLQNDQGCQIAYNGGVVDRKHFNNRSYIIIGASSNNGGARRPIDFDVANVIVWSCLAYKTSQCNGTSLANQSLPTGQTLSYYH